MLPLPEWRAREMTERERQCYEKLVLSVEKLCSRNCISWHTVEQCRFDVWEDVAYDLVNAIVTRNIPSMGEQRISFPTTWWDAFKERWFPIWALKRWPVNRTTYEAKRLFPDMPKEFGKPIDLLIKR